MLLQGCDIFSPPEIKDSTGTVLPPYPTLERPERVLQALDMAYERRDSLKYKELYDSTYTGSSTDLNANQGGTIDITYADELAHIGALARAPGIRTTFDLGPEATWFRRGSTDPSHPEWAVIQIAGYEYLIRIDDGSNSIEARPQDPGNFQEFTFGPTIDHTSPTDTLWKIVRWTEFGRSVDPVPAVP
jgi:hypothetical protein